MLSAAQAKGLAGRSQALTVAREEVPEELAQVGVVGLVVKAQGAAVLEVGGELHGEALAEHLDGRRHLLLADLLVLLLFRQRLQSLRAFNVSDQSHCTCCLRTQQKCRPIYRSD